MGRLSRRSSSTTFLRPESRTGGSSERLLFDSLVPFAGERIQGEGIQKETEQRIAVSIGPQFGTVDPEWITARGSRSN